jgi:hypothetical protein
MIWSCVHGMVSLKIRKRVNILDAAEVDQIIENSYQSLVSFIDQQ